MGKYLDFFSHNFAWMTNFAKNLKNRWSKELYKHYKILNNVSIYILFIKYTRYYEINGLYKLLYICKCKCKCGEI